MVNATLRSLHSGKRNPIPIVHEVGWASWPSMKRLVKSRLPRSSNPGPSNPSRVAILATYIILYYIILYYIILYYIILYYIILYIILYYYVGLYTNYPSSLKIHKQCGFVSAVGMPCLKQSDADILRLGRPLLKAKRSDAFGSNKLH